MPIDHLLTEPATVISRTPTTGTVVGTGWGAGTWGSGLWGGGGSGTSSRDSYGNVLLAEASRMTFCWHEQTLRSENTVGADVREETWTAYFPSGDPLSSTDKVTINGVSFEVVGQPWQTWNPRSSTNGHVVATLRRTDG